jgi:hypothetical protein
MSHLLVLGAYGYEDGYYALTFYLKKFFDTISFFPLFIYNDKTQTSEYYDECLLKMINGTLEKCSIPKLLNFQHKKTHVLYYHNFDYLKNNMKTFNLITEHKDFKFIMINWDPFSCLKNNPSNEILNKFDVIYLSHMILTGINIKPLFTGFINEITYFQKNENYECDVLFIGTTLYENNIYGNESNVNRKNILDEYYRESRIKLNIFSNNQNIKNVYPNSFRGPISYNNSKLAYSNAVMTLNISPLKQCLFNGHHYYSERLPQILACNSVMISNDNFTGLLEPDEDYIYIKKLKDLIPKTLHYKRHPEKLNQIRENYKKKIHLFDYKNINDMMISDFQKL